MLTLAITSTILNLLGVRGLCLLICLITESPSLPALPDSLLSCDVLILINGITASDLQSPYNSKEVNVASGHLDHPSSH